MPIDLFGEIYLDESEFAAKLGCSEAALRRVRVRGAIGYQRLPGRRGAFYGKQHIAERLAALSVPACRKETPGSDNADSPNEALTRSNTAAGSTKEGVTLSDIQRASEILARRKGDPKPSS